VSASADVLATGETGEGVEQARKVLELISQVGRETWRVIRDFAGQSNQLAGDVHARVEAARGLSTVGASPGRGGRSETWPSRAGTRAAIWKAVMQAE
jgi:hypothetical protein